jgi:hypothetical protein
VKRKDVAVSARKGYFDGNPADAPRQTIENVPPAISDMLTASWPRTDLPLQASVAAFASPDGSRPIVSTVIGSSSGGTEHTPGTDAAEVDVVVAAFDSNGRSANYHRQTLGLTSARGTPYEALSKLPLDPGAYEMRIAVNDRATGRIGTVFTSIDVPDFAKAPLSLSGVVLEVRPQELVAADDALREVIPVVPTARRVLDRSDRATAFLRVYQGGLDALRPVEVKMRIQNAAGTPVINTARSLTSDDFAKGRGADYTVELPLETLEPGEYLLTIEASERVRTVGRDVRFRIR